MVVLVKGLFSAFSLTDDTNDATFYVNASVVYHTSFRWVWLVIPGFFWIP